MNTNVCYCTEWNWFDTGAWIIGSLIISCLTLCILALILLLLLDIVVSFVFTWRIYKASIISENKSETFKQFLVAWFNHLGGHDSPYVTMTRTGERVWYPWPYVTKKSKQAIIDRENNEWDRYEQSMRDYDK